MPAAGPKPIGRAGSSTVVQGPYGTQVTKPTILARAVVAVRKQFFTAKDLANPERLYQVLYQMQQGHTTALHALASSPLSVGTAIGPFTFTAGQTQNLNHGLGRAFTGWFPIDAQTNAWSGKRVALPTGVDPSQQIALKSDNAGTYSFWVF